MHCTISRHLTYHMKAFQFSDKHLGAYVANALFHVYVCVGDYTLPLDHSVLVRSNLGYHGDAWDYVWST